MKILDHGFVEVVSAYGDDLTIVNAARVSFGKSATTFDLEKDGALIRYLAEHQHMSPFRHCHLTMRIKMPIFVMRQFVRHRIGVEINEISGRYAELPSEYYVPQEWRNQSTDNKQGSEGVHGASTDVDALYRLNIDQCISAYKTMLMAGVAREMARMVLPVSMYTEIFVTMSLEAIVHFCKLREDSHAQWEIREYARAIHACTEQYFPNAFRALMEHNNA